MTHARDLAWLHYQDMRNRRSAVMKTLIDELVMSPSAKEMWHDEQHRKRLERRTGEPHPIVTGELGTLNGSTILTDK